MARCFLPGLGAWPFLSCVINLLSPPVAETKFPYQSVGAQSKPRMHGLETGPKCLQWTRYTTGTLDLPVSDTPLVISPSRQPARYSNMEGQLASGVRKPESTCSMRGAGREEHDGCGLDWTCDVTTPQQSGLDWVQSWQARQEQQLCSPTLARTHRFYL